LDALDRLDGLDSSRASFPGIATGSEMLRLLERMVQQEDAWFGAEASLIPAAENQAPDR
jgi:hypothetical protein